MEVTHTPPHGYSRCPECGSDYHDKYLPVHLRKTHGLAALQAEARRLQSALDEVTDEQMLLWAHGFLTGLADRIAARVPQLRQGKTT